MAKFRGTVRRSDLEGGHWQLEGDDGETYVLEGDAIDAAGAGGAGAVQDGARVEIDGAVDRNVMSFAMTGTTLKVRGVKAA